MHKLFDEIRGHRFFRDLVMQISNILQQPPCMAVPKCVCSRQQRAFELFSQRIAVLGPVQTTWSAVNLCNRSGIVVRVTSYFVLPTSRCTCFSHCKTSILCIIKERPIFDAGAVFRDTCWSSICLQRHKNLSVYR